MSGEITTEIYNIKKNMIEAERAELKEFIDGFNVSNEKQIESAEKTLNFAQQAYEAFKIGDEEQKRTIVQLLGGNPTLKDRRLTVELPPPLTLFSDLKLPVHGSVEKEIAELGVDKIRVKLIKSFFEGSCLDFLQKV